MSIYNPAVIANNQVWPKDGEKYLNQNLKHKGMFHLDDPAVKILTRHGWYWGAFFPDGVGYQHFQKVMIDHYMITGAREGLFVVKKPVNLKTPKISKTEFLFDSKILLIEKDEKNIANTESIQKVIYILNQCKYPAVFLHIKYGKNML